METIIERLYKKYPHLKKDIVRPTVTVLKSAKDLYSQVYELEQKTETLKYLIKTIEEEIEDAENVFKTFLALYNYASQIYKALEEVDNKLSAEISKLESAKAQILSEYYRVSKLALKEYDIFNTLVDKVTEERKKSYSDRLEDIVNKRLSDIFSLISGGKEETKKEEKK